jgi:hypothetical protein
MGLNIASGIGFATLLRKWGNIDSRIAGEVG